MNDPDERTITLSRDDALTALEVVVWRAMLRAIHEGETTLRRLNVPRHRIPCEIVALWTTARDVPCESAGELVTRLGAELDALEAMGSMVHLGRPASVPPVDWRAEGATVSVERGSMFALTLAAGGAETVASFRVRTAPSSEYERPGDSALTITTEHVEGLDAWAMDELVKVAARIADCRG